VAFFSEGELYIGKAQEKTAVFRTIHKQNAETGKSYPWISWRSALTNLTTSICWTITVINIQKFPLINTEKIPGGRVKLLFFSCFFSLFESVRIVAGFENVAVMGHTIQWGIRTFPVNTGAFHHNQFRFK